VVEASLIRPRPSETKLVVCAWHPFTLWRAPARLAERVHERFPDLRVVHVPTYDLLNPELPDTMIFVGYSLRPDQLALTRKLLWIHSTAAGVVQLVYPEMQSSNVIITNASGVHAVPMAEHTLGLILALARRFPSAWRYQREKHWAQQEIWDETPGPRELSGAMLCIIGFGRVGREVARCSKPFGTRVRAVTRSGAGDLGLADEIFPASRLRDALRGPDYVVIAAPETKETFHLIGKSELSSMKRSAYLLNVSRGSLVDEAALIEALREGRIAGAAIDVAEEEPLPPESPLWRLDNLFITPHLSAASSPLWERQGDLLLQNLDRWFAGRELLNQVDLARGY